MKEGYVKEAVTVHEKTHNHMDMEDPNIPCTLIARVDWYDYEVWHTHDFDKLPGDDAIKEVMAEYCEGRTRPVAASWFLAPATHQGDYVDETNKIKR